MSVKITHKGDFKKTERFLNRMKKNDYIKNVLNKYGEIGVRALSNATPVDSGTTASSWDYEIIISRRSSIIYWTNNNINNGVNIAIILQYGHGTGTGGYVQGYDYINPAMKSIFDKIANEAWEEVTSA